MRKEIGCVQYKAAMKMSLEGNRVREGEVRGGEGRGGRGGEGRGGREGEGKVGRGAEGTRGGRGREGRGESQEKSVKERGECVKSRVSRG